MIENHVIIQKSILGMALNRRKKTETVSEPSQLLEGSPLLIAGTAAGAWAKVAERLLLAMVTTEGSKLWRLDTFRSRQ